MSKKVTVVISQAQGKNPTKRHLEEELAAALIMSPDVEVSLVPHLYDLTADHTGMLFLKSVPGDMIILSWLYPRAARWVLDRNGVKGHAGVSLLKSADDDEEESDEDPPAEEERPNALGPWDIPKRRIYCIDLRGNSNPAVYLEEIRRIAGEATVQTVDLMSWIGGQPKAEQLQRYLNPVRLPAGNGEQGAGDRSQETGVRGQVGNGSAAPTIGDALGMNANGSSPGASSHLAPRDEASGTSPLPTSTAASASPPITEEPVRRRWYPVIDYSRCTNCMECIDFCLFGVYGLDAAERILVEQQDNCKKGCPACSRVCPENAIIFPEHKTAAIAGADVGLVTGLKIDLSKLFGAPSALEEAVMERDTELVQDGREAVGMTVGIPKRQTGKAKSHDALDDLMDGLDALV